MFECEYLVSDWMTVSIFVSESECFLFVLYCIVMKVEERCVRALFARKAVSDGEQLVGSLII